MMKRSFCLPAMGVWHRLLMVMLMAFAAFAARPVQALTLQLSPGSLQLAPSGPYSTARDQAVGTVLATATSTLTASNISGSCLITALMLPGSSANGNIFTTGNPGLGVTLYYYNGATRVQIVPGIQASLSNTLTSPGTVTKIEANLIVTGQISTGTLSSLPSVTLTFAAVGLGCGVLNLGAQVLNVTVSNGVVTSLSCVVTTPSITVTLPTVAASSLATVGATAGSTQFTIGLNCPGAATNVYVTITDASNAANTTTNLGLKNTSTAGGVAIQLLRPNGALVAYGPDSAVAGNTNQWLVGSSTSVGGISLTARYVATGTPTPGSVSAAATFTMSYQ